MKISDFRDLLVWQKSMQLVTEVYSLTKLLPNDEIYALTSQMRRAVVSIPSNIAEGQQRKTTKEFLYFLSNARASNAEIQTQLYICLNLGYLDEEQISSTLNLSFEISKMINALINNLN
ncbi:MAG: four helix bundle protein [Eubacterium sp.]|nr:four helix bundle protein [Eubacterium sp.]